MGFGMWGGVVIWAGIEIRVRGRVIGNILGACCTVAGCISAGGGYGGMAHVVLSFSARRQVGHYIIYDLPEVRLLAADYLLLTNSP